MGYSAETIQKMAYEVYGVELSEKRAVEIAGQVTELAESARKAGHESDFNDELLSARQALMQSEVPGESS